MAESSSVFYSGFYGSASVGANELALMMWSVTPTVQLVEFRNSRSGNYVVRQSTFSDVSGDLTVDYDFANDYFAAPFNLNPGTILTNLLLYLHQPSKSELSGPEWTFASVIIDSTPQTLDINGKIGTKFSFKGAGGNVTPP